MDELYIKLRKHVYERLDIGRDVADSELYEVIDACIYDESRNNVISIRQKEELKQRLYNSIKKLDNRQVKKNAGVFICSRSIRIYR